MHKNLIIWQKWFDPFGGDEEQTNNAESLEINDDYEDDKIENDYPILNHNPVRAIATPMGLIPFTENTSASKIFNFWIGHTNFNITKNISDIIEKVDGVETLDIFTRYRFRIAIGKAFDASVTMKEINDKVYQYLE